MDADSKRRLDELIPWYVTGRIGEVDRAWVEQMVREFPQARAELEWHRRLHHEIHRRFEDVPAEIGLDGLMRKVRAEQRRPAAKPAGGWLREFFGSLGARPAYTFASAVIVVQAGVIGALLLRDAPQPEYAQTRAIAPRAAIEAPVLQVTFKPDVTERAMRLLLIKLGGRVIDGPGQLGDYIVAVPPQRIEPVRQALEESGMVDAVAVLAQRPERE